MRIRAISVVTSQWSKNRAHQQPRQPRIRQNCRTLGRTTAACLATLWTAQGSSSSSAMTYAWTSRVTYPGSAPAFVTRLSTTRRGVALLRPARSATREAESLQRPSHVVALAANGMVSRRAEYLVDRGERPGARMMSSFPGSRSQDQLCGAGVGAGWSAGVSQCGRRHDGTLGSR